jgi:hypothetical protein
MPPTLSDLPVGTRVHAKWHGDVDVALAVYYDTLHWTHLVGKVTRIEPDPGGDPDLDYLWVLPEDGGDEVRIKPRVVSEVLALFPSEAKGGPDV